MVDLQLKADSALSRNDTYRAWNADIKVTGHSERKRHRKLRSRTVTSENIDLIPIGLPGDWLNRRQAGIFFRNLRSGIGNLMWQFDQRSRAHPRNLATGGDR
jgi:hypothetical protein